MKKTTSSASTSVSIDIDLMAHAHARAKSLGLKFSPYIAQLIRRDLAGGKDFTISEEPSISPARKKSYRKP